MWEEVIAAASGVVAFFGRLMGLYVGLRHAVRRSHDLLQKDFNHLQSAFGSLRTDFGSLRAEFGSLRTESREDSRRLDQKIDIGSTGA